MNELYDIEVETAEGETYSLRRYRGHAMLIVNTASECGFTPQFDGLQQLHERYEAAGLTVLGFPCNQFGNQDPASNAKIQSFCRIRFGVTFPMHAKIEVNGDNAHPLYRYLCAVKPGVLGTSAIKWNFTKFLVGPQGQVLDRFAPRVKPAALKKAIDHALPPSVSRQEVPEAELKFS